MPRRLRQYFSSLIIVLALFSLSSFRPQFVSADCGGPVPPAPSKIWLTGGPKAGEVTLHWDAAPHANRYAVAYGTVSGKYIYGADNIGGEQSRSYSVKSLSPGVKYYFRLAAANGCASSPFSAEVSATTRGGVAVTTVQPVKQARLDSARQGGVPSSVNKLSASSGPLVGEVTLRWQNYEGADNYHLVYGTENGKYQYGALNIGKVNKFTVGKLSPGTAYYFALVPVSGNRAMETTPAVKAWARAKSFPVEVVVTNREALVQPQPRVTQPTTVPPAEIFGTPPPSAEVTLPPISTEAPVQATGSPNF